MLVYVMGSSRINCHPITEPTMTSSASGDELHLTICPRIFGGRHAPTIVDGEGFTKLADAAGLKLISARRVGDEMFFIYKVGRKPHA